MDKIQEFPIEVMQVRLSHRCRAILNFTGKPPDAEAIERLKRYLRIFEETLPTEAELLMRDKGYRAARVKRFGEMLAAPTQEEESR